ncbi:MAG: hypothetical protein E3J37_09400 [Anaerolineales bacterium]|nr:MAG: hypothetical protein E3J37_09400 [Anaerolineales bacterium]
MPTKLTNQDVWLSTVFFSVLTSLLLIPLQQIFNRDLFNRSTLGVIIASAIYWGILALILMYKFWDLYYGHFYPIWIRRLAPLNIILYGAFGLGLHWLTSHQNTPSILTFALLGGLHGIAEHIFAIYGLHILEKVPFLQGLTPLPVLIFSFFEYMLYWTMVAWLTFAIVKLI